MQWHGGADGEERCRRVRAVPCRRRCAICRCGAAEEDVADADRLVVVGRWLLVLLWRGIGRDDPNPSTAHLPIPPIFNFIHVTQIIRRSPSRRGQQQIMGGGANSSSTPTSISISPTTIQLLEYNLLSYMFRNVPF